jgi:mannose/fructose/N-acetylgalactosamine-specific phosphotransferase system component IID
LDRQRIGRHQFGPGDGDVSGPDQVWSWTAKVWSVMLSVFALVLVLNITWTLLRPLIPMIFIVGIIVLGIVAWNRARWR